MGERHAQALADAVLGGDEIPFASYSATNPLSCGRVTFGRCGTWHNQSLTSLLLQASKQPHVALCVAFLAVLVLACGGQSTPIGNTSARPEYAFSDGVMILDPQDVEKLEAEWKQTYPSLRLAASCDAAPPHAQHACVVWSRATDAGAIVDAEAALHPNLEAWRAAARAVASGGKSSGRLANRCRDLVAKGLRVSVDGYGGWSAADCPSVDAALAPLAEPLTACSKETHVMLEVLEGGNPMLCMGLGSREPCACTMLQKVRFPPIRDPMHPWRRLVFKLRPE